MVNHIYDISIDIEALYEKLGKTLQYATIQKTVSHETEYYDLYNHNKILSVCDGETVVAKYNKTDDTYTIQANGEDNTVKLTRKELQIATNSF